MFSFIVFSEHCSFQATSFTAIDFECLLNTANNAISFEGSISWKARYTVHIDPTKKKVAELILQLQSPVGWSKDMLIRSELNDQLKNNCIISACNCSGCSTYKFINRAENVTTFRLLFVTC